MKKYIIICLILTAIVALFSCSSGRFGCVTTYGKVGYGASKDGRN